MTSEYVSQAEVAEDAPTFGSRSYDPFWEVALSLELAVSLHCITSGQPKVRSRSPYVQYLDVIYDAQRSLAEIVCGGVLERFPTLIVVSAENDCGWFPHFLFRLDHAHEKFGRFAPYPLPMRPSDYVRRQVYATFQKDSTVPSVCDGFGADRYVGLGLSARRFNLATISVNHCRDPGQTP